VDEGVRFEDRAPYDFEAVDHYGQREYRDEERAAQHGRWSS
jgi:hypothetical protein